MSSSSIIEAEIWVKPGEVREKCINACKTVLLPALCVALLVGFALNSDGSLQALVSRQLKDQTLEHTAHKALLPLDQTDYWGIFAVTLGLLVAASGGIGGGGILVPLYILVFDFRPKYAVALSNFTIVGSSITNIVLNLPKRHPNANRPLVDWDLILVMEPLTMAGVIFGAFLSQILPDWILVISLVFLLAFTTYTTLEKGIQQFNKETKVAEAQRKSILQKQLEADKEESESQPLLAAQTADDVEKATVLAQKQSQQQAKEIQMTQTNKSDVEETYSSFPKDNSNELEELLATEQNTPMDKVTLVSVMIGMVIILNFLKGGGSSFPSPLGITCNSGGYWLITIAVFVWILAFSVYMRQLLIEKWRLKSRLRYKYIEGDIEWSPVNTLVYPLICFFAGLFAGLFGIGGGIVKGPLMLYMGVHPLVASATTAVMIMFTSVAGTTMYIAFGTLQWDYGIFLFILGLLATVVGQFGVSYLVQKYNRVSLVSLSIGAVVALSTILMAIQSIFSLIDAENRPEKSSLCGK